MCAVQKPSSHSINPRLPEDYAGHAPDNASAGITRAQTVEPLTPTNLRDTASASARVRVPEQTTPVGVMRQCIANAIVNQVRESTERLKPDVYVSDTVLVPNGSGVRCIESYLVKVDLKEDSNLRAHASHINQINFKTKGEGLDPDPEDRTLVYRAGQSPAGAARSTGRAAAPALSLACQKALVEGIDSGLGLYQFVSRRAHYQPDKSKETPIINSLRKLWEASQKSGEEVTLGGRFRVTKFKQHPAAAGDRIHYSLTVTDIKSGKETCVPLTQAGMKFTGRLLKVPEIETANAILDAHRGLVSEEASTGFRQAEPTIYSYAGIGRNATLIAYRRVISLIEQGQVPDLDRLRTELTGAIRLERMACGKRFLHSDVQIKEVWQALSKKVIERCASRSDVARMLNRDDPIVPSPASGVDFLKKKLEAEHHPLRINWNRAVEEIGKQDPDRARRFIAAFENSEVVKHLSQRQLDGVREHLQKTNSESSTENTTSGKPADYKPGEREMLLETEWDEEISVDIKAQPFAAGAFELWNNAGGGNCMFHALYSKARHDNLSEESLGKIRHKTALVKFRSEESDHQMRRNFTEIMGALEQTYEGDSIQTNLNACFEENKIPKEISNAQLAACQERVGVSTGDLELEQWFSLPDNKTESVVVIDCEKNAEAIVLLHLDHGRLVKHYLPLSIIKDYCTLEDIHGIIKNVLRDAMKENLKLRDSTSQARHIALYRQPTHWQKIGAQRPLK